MDRTVRWPRLPWFLCGLAVALVLAAAALRILTVDADPQTADEAWTALDMTGALAVPVMGAVLARRLPENRLGWIWCAFAITNGTLLLAGEIVTRAAGGWPGQLQRAAFLTELVLLPLVFLLFPTGRLPGPGWRWLPRGMAVCLLVAVVSGPFVATPSDPSYQGPLTPGGAAGERWWAVYLVGLGGLFLSSVAAMVSVAVRLRRAGPVERRQLEWFAYAALINAVTLVVALTDVVGDVGWVLFELTFVLIPVAVGIAVLRYRLFEIDRIISRTVSYAVLTTVLLLTYLAVVGLLRGLLAPVTGTTDLAVAASTLAVAAVFQPARRRVQGLVDRRFDRARYDAARTVETYARRLRTEVDLEAVTTGLRDTVTATVGPQRVGLWLRDGAATRSTS